MDVVATYGYRLVSPGRLANREGAARASGPAFETDASPEGDRKGNWRKTSFVDRGRHHTVSVGRGRHHTVCFAAKMMPPSLVPDI